MDSLWCPSFCLFSLLVIPSVTGDLPLHRTGVHLRDG